jgi:hypothetical protein
MSEITAAVTTSKVVVPPVVSAVVRSVVLSDYEDQGADGNSLRPPSRRRLDLGCSAMSLDFKSGGGGDG